VNKEGRKTVYRWYWQSDKRAGSFNIFFPMKMKEKEAI